MDHLSPEQRSKLMSRIRRRDTKPEIAVRRVAHALGYRYRLHRAADLPGCPDLVFGPRRKVIFVHECFWHQHNCKRGTQPRGSVGKAHVRTGPSDKRPIVGTFSPDATDIVVRRCEPAARYRYKWCVVSHKDLEGWTYGRYLVRMGTKDTRPD